MNFGKAMGQSEEPKEKEFFTPRDQTKRSHLACSRSMVHSFSALSIKTNIPKTMAMNYGDGMAKE